MYQLKTSKIRQAGIWLSETMLTTVVIGVLAGVVYLAAYTAINDAYGSNAQDITTTVYAASTDIVTSLNGDFTKISVGGTPDAFWDQLANGGYLQTNYLSGCDTSNGAYANCDKKSPWNNSITFKLNGTSPYTSLQMQMPTSSPGDCGKLRTKFDPQNKGTATCVTPSGGTNGATEFHFVVAGDDTSVS